MLDFRRRYATRPSNAAGPALKRRAKFRAPLRGETPSVQCLPSGSMASDQSSSHYFFFDEDFLPGTLAPAFRASDNPMAIACFLLVTFLPDRPLFRVPSFRSCIAFSTFSDAFFPYLAMFSPPSSLDLTNARPGLCHGPFPAEPDAGQNSYRSPLMKQRPVSSSSRNHDRLVLRNDFRRQPSFHPGKEKPNCFLQSP
jgi:hypothetical protein